MISNIQYETVVVGHPVKTLKEDTEGDHTARV